MASDADAGTMWIPLGRVKSVNIPRRELRVSPYAGKGQAIMQSEWLWIRMPDTRGSEPLRCAVEQTRPHHHEVIIRVGAGVPRDTVARMKTAEATASAAYLESRGLYEGRIWQDMRLEHEGGGYFGIVREVLELPAQTVLRVESADGGRYLLPAVEACVRVVSHEAKRAIVHDLDAFAVEDED